jgi:homoisocitrate dehydrogenase
MAQVINDAVDANVIEGAIKTPDLGGSNSLDDVLQDILKRIN